MTATTTMNVDVQTALQICREWWERVNEGWDGAAIEEKWIAAGYDPQQVRETIESAKEEVAD